jgi:hypothetical protein
MIEYIAAPSVGGQRELLYKTWKKCLNSGYTTLIDPISEYPKGTNWYKVERDNGFIVKVRLFFDDEDEFLLWLLKFS